MCALRLPTSVRDRTPLARHERVVGRVLQPSVLVGILTKDALPCWHKRDARTIASRELDHQIRQDIGVHWLDDVSVEPRLARLLTVRVLTPTRQGDEH